MNDNRKKPITEKVLKKKYKLKQIEFLEWNYPGR
jgi:hypothetical protein